MHTDPTITHTNCKRCGAEAHSHDDVVALFGFRNDAGTIRVQASCRACRNKPSERPKVWDIAPTLTYGVEVEWTHGCTRLRAAIAVAEMFRREGFEVDHPWNATTVKVKFSNRAGSPWLQFRFVHDATVSGEMTTPPLYLDELWMVQKVVRAMKDAGCKTRRNQAGIHVHVGVQNLTINNIRTLARLVAVWEDHIKAAVNTHHRRMRWCKDMEASFKASLTSKGGDWDRDTLDKAWYDNNGGHSGKSGKYHNSRYHGLNLHAVFTKGTVEFRYFDGTLHAGRIRAYVTMCLAMVARSVATKQAPRKAKTFDGSMDKFLSWMELGKRTHEVTRFHLTNNARSRQGLAPLSWPNEGATGGA